MVHIVRASSCVVCHAQDFAFYSGLLATTVCLSCRRCFHVHYLSSSNAMCRYLAVRAGLAVAVELDVAGRQERTPMGKLQPGSLTATYQFLPKRSLLPEARVSQNSCHTPVHSCACHILLALQLAM